MSDNVVLHVGFEKTGTKAIQYWLRDHERLLAQHGLRFPRGWLRLNCHQELPLTLMRLNRLCSPRELGDDWRDERWRTDVLRQVSDDLDAHRDVTTVLSSENLDLLRYDDEFSALRELVGDARIVVYLRDPASWLEALRDQYLHKNGPGRSLSSDRDAYNYLEPDTWRVEYETLLDGWFQWFTHVRIERYNRLVSYEGSVIPSFCRILGVPVVDVDGYNMNQRGHATPRAPGNRSVGLRFGQTEGSSDAVSVSTAAGVHARSASEDREALGS